jgi:hypothetical protein
MCVCVCACVCVCVCVCIVHNTSAWHLQDLPCPHRHTHTRAHTPQDRRDGGRPLRLRAAPLALLLDALPRRPRDVRAYTCTHTVYVCVHACACVRACVRACLHPPWYPLTAPPPITTTTGTTTTTATCAAATAHSSWTASWCVCACVCVWCGGACILRFRLSSLSVCPSPRPPYMPSMITGLEVGMLKHQEGGGDRR